MRRSAFLIAASSAVVAACATTPMPPMPAYSGAPLPEGREALIAEADRNAARGPAGPDLGRSRAAAFAVLAQHPGDIDAAWRAARAFWLEALGRRGGEEAAELGKRCIQELEPLALGPTGNAELAFYVALCMGMRAEAKPFEGRGLVKRMVELGGMAVDRDPKVVHAGPHRLLGGIYLRAPSWPASVGDPDEALEQLEKAVELDPAWAENHLLLAEALLAHDREEDAARELAMARELMGAPDVADWRPLWSADAEALDKKIGRR